MQGTYIQSPFTIDSSNIDKQDPLFIDEQNENFQLTLSSPCINTGSNQAPFLPSKDMDGNPRICNGIVDMGAYEFIDNVGCGRFLPFLMLLLDYWYTCYFNFLLSIYSREPFLKYEDIHHTS
jgi:hypothetical protein